MMARSRSVLCLLRLLLMSMGLAGALLPPLARQAAAQGSSRTINGHAVAGRFLEVWSSQGSEQANVYVNGLPITDRRAEVSLNDGKTYETQWFERARYEAHPGNAAPYDVLLGLLGTSLVEGRGAVNPSTGAPRNPADAPFVGIDKPADADGRTIVWFPETKHTISGKILEYWNKYGGLKQFGFPLSEPLQELSPSDGKTYTVQYFERNRFELHPEKTAPYEVELGLLGVQQYKAQPIPAGQLPISPPAGGTTTKDTLVMAVSQEPSSLFPMFESTAVAQLVSEPLYSSLVNRDSSDNLYPEVAWYVPTLENGGAFYAGGGDNQHLVVKYKLRPGIKWADGQEITSADVAFYQKLITDPAAGRGRDRTLYYKVYNLVTPDRYTAIFSFMSYAQARDIAASAQFQQEAAYLKPYVEDKRPVVDAQYATVGNILPAHILGSVPPERIIENAYARNPVGSGPFKLDHWTPGQEIVLARNPNYNLTSPPLLSRIIIKLVADPNQAIAQLKSGDLDAVGGDVIRSANPLLDKLSTSGQQVDYVPTASWEHIDFNLDSPGLTDVAVRRAIAQAINRQKIIDTVLLGHAAVLDTFVPPGSWASMQNAEFARQWSAHFPLHRYPYDPNIAKQTLDQAGWVPGPDGIRAKGNVRLAFEYAAPAGSSARTQVMQMVLDDLKQLGIFVKIVTPAKDRFFDVYMPNRQHDMAEYSTQADTEPSGSAYTSQAVPSQANTFLGANYPGYRNPTFDSLVRAADAEVNRSKRAPLLAQMQQIWSEELPVLPLYAQPSIEVHKVSLVNWDPSGTATYPLYRAAALYFR